MSSILDSLNPAQREAASHIDGPLLILAGAGSGKTKTLTTRLAYLIDEVGIPANQTLTLTFTNKASSEMRDRALNLLTKTTSSIPLLCTFHRFGLLFLKFYIHTLNRKNNFVLLDSTDTKNILKKINITSSLPLSFLRNEISNYKNNLITPQMALADARSKEQKEFAQIYHLYTNQLIQDNLVDFDDLLLLPYQILESNPSLCHEVSERYHYIMVDEYQDTNLLQFKLLESLCTSHQNLCVVGDDDQSIYSWRGANIGNILNFQAHFKNAKLIKLEENYRSTTQILNIANTLIAHNTNRIGKTLKSIRGDGEEVELFHFKDGGIEANQIAKKILELKQSGTLAKEIAILFRLNALSRNLEEALSKHKIPYRLVGTIRFYERSEIKDIISYLRYIYNRNDDFSFSRIINTPRRGIGPGAQEKILELAASQNKSIYDLFLENRFVHLLTPKVYYGLQEFFSTIEALRDYLETPQLLVKEILERTQLLKTYKNNEEALDRSANIQEFAALMYDYFMHNKDHDLQDFLNSIPLHSDSDEIEDEDCIRIMSIHTSKGLEFDCIFVIGLENHFFPLMHEDGNLEEERRLAYVAFTRARKKLYVSYVDSRFYKGKTSLLEPSLFLRESSLLQKKGPSPIIHQSSTTSEEFEAGDLINHKIFGTGRVQAIKYAGGDQILTINFGGLVKSIMASFVQKLED